MNALGRLGLYGAGLAALFVAAFVAAGAVVPDQVVDDWARSADSGGMGGHGSAPAQVRGLSLEQDGYRLGRVTVPDEVDRPGTLSFAISDAAGAPVTDFATSHDQQLHLIVVRSDGTEFRHAHPTMSTDGVWSMPWRWTAAGVYRVYADFVPAATGQAVTVTRTVEVAGSFGPAAATAVSTTDEVDGFEVSVSGTLSAGNTSRLTVHVVRDDLPVTTLQPYLGAYGHLVVLREGDLAYLHVHPEGDQPRPGQVSGPEVEFMTEAPTAGRYLLYLDFKVDDRVHTATFVLDATPPSGDPPAGPPGHSGD